MVSKDYTYFRKTGNQGRVRRYFTFRIHPFILVSLLLFPTCLTGQGLKETPSQEGLASQRDKVIEKFEKEKSERMKKNVGKWFIIVRPGSAAEFFVDPNIPENKVRVKEKDAFTVLEVVKNDKGDGNFYRVRMDSGMTVYLSADALYLELKIREGSIAPLSKKEAGSKRLQEGRKK